MKTIVRFLRFNLLAVSLGLILAIGCKKDEEAKITDADGNIYTSVTIGTQVWMVENLKTTKYNDGTDIPEVTDRNQWMTLTTGAFCWYNNDASTYKTPYGGYYNWWAVNTGKLCPSGWHVPTDADMNTLITFLGGWEIAGNKLKEKGTAHWVNNSSETTNESGFTALPGGFRDGFNGYFADTPGTRCWYWFINKSNNPGDSPLGYLLLLYDKSNAYLGRFYIDNQYAEYQFRNGLSVRCIKN